MPGSGFLKSVYAVALLFVLPVFICSCGGRVKIFPDLSHINTVTVIPFYSMATGDGAPIPRTMPGEGGDGAAVVTSILTDMLTENFSFALVPVRQANHHPTLRDGDFPTQELLQYVMEAGRLSGADAVFFGYVNRFRERVGGEYAVNLSAAVSFQIFLVSTVDGTVLWQDAFEETQVSLSENLLTVGRFVKRGGRWVTAEELAAWGMEKVLGGEALNTLLKKRLQ